jgi:Tfp pilus assembly protein PilF
LALARYLNRVGRSEDSTREYVIAIGPNGSFPGIRRELAAVYLKLNRRDDARVELERALQDAPASGQLLEDLGDLEAGAGQAAKAEERYHAAESEYASGSDKTRVHRKIERLSGNRSRV